MTHFQSQSLCSNNYIKTLDYQTSSSVYALPFGKETMTAEELSFEKVLEEIPTLHELCEHVRIGSKWYWLGIILKLDSTRLESIKMLSEDLTYKTVKMFELWLDTNLHPTRRQIIDALRKDVIGENFIAIKYEETLRKLCCK